MNMKCVLWLGSHFSRLIKMTILKKMRDVFFHLFPFRYGPSLRLYFTTFDFFNGLKPVATKWIDATHLQFEISFLCFIVFFLFYFFHLQADSFNLYNYFTTRAKGSIHVVTPDFNPAKCM